MSGNVKTYAPLDEAYVKDVINGATHKDEFAKYLSGHFVGLDRPASVSIGIDSANMQVVCEILKSRGIDVAYVGTKEALDINKFVIDETGIKTPFMEPKDLLQVTALMYDILYELGIVPEGFALPQTAESLAIPTIYKGKKIDICDELDDNYWAKEVLKKHGKTAKEFITQQIEASKKLETINAMQVSAENAAKGFPKLYRGGTLGSKAYAVVASRRSKDCAYATPWMNTAVGYSQGLEAGYVGVDDVKYGFVYEYDASPQQKYYCDYGIETGANATETKKEVYETPVFAHQNKCTAVYFTTNDGRVVKITDENGNFISKEWEDFVKLHDARVRTGNKYDKMRVVKQLRALSYGEVYAFKTSKKIKCLDLQDQYNVDLSGIDLSNVEEVKLPMIVKSLKGAKLPKKVDWSRCYDIDLSGADLSNVDNLKLPMIVKSVKDTKFPKKVDFSECFNIDLSGADLSNAINVKFPKFVKSFEGCKFPKNVDLKNCYDVDLS